MTLGMRGLECVTWWIAATVPLIGDELLAGMLTGLMVRVLHAKSNIVTE